jgi:Ca2+-binding RTX toxin-like protein
LIASFILERLIEDPTMKKSVIYASICVCIGCSVMADAALAKGKPNSNCPNADVVLSKQYPNFDLNHACQGTYPGAYNNSDECDPNNQDPTTLGIDDQNGLVIAGTNGRNIIHGTSGPDTICGGNGNDEIYGEEGDDTIYGDNGNDSLYGGPGSDEIHGGNGKDRLWGYNDVPESEEAVVDPSTDEDMLFGENGQDDLRGGPGDDEISGGNGKDSMDGGAGVDDISGGRGKDSCTDPDATDCDASNLEDGPKHH